MSESLQHCLECGAELPAVALPNTESASGESPAASTLCPKCLLRLGFETGMEPEAEATTNADTKVSEGDDQGIPNEGDANDREPSKNPSGAATPLVSPSPSFEPRPRQKTDLRKYEAIFPDLEIVRELGQGGMGTVLLARQTKLDRNVALKILRTDLASDPAFSERFMREARALAKLSHPSIIGVHDFGERDGIYYFIMEYVAGSNLRHIVREGNLQPNEALAIVPQICDALQYAHDQGVVHRDIKPENILIGEDGRVKIADFGLAKMVDPESKDFTLTGTRQVMGTPHYMAPEQMEKPQEVDHRADIYSLGVVFYEMLTGELPLGRFAPPSKKVEINVRLDEVVMRTLEKEPELRYQQVTEVKTHVEKICDSDDANFTDRALERLATWTSAAKDMNWTENLDFARTNIVAGTKKAVAGLGAAGSIGATIGGAAFRNSGSAASTTAKTVSTAADSIWDKTRPLIPRLWNALLFILNNTKWLLLAALGLLGSLWRAIRGPLGWMWIWTLFCGILFLFLRFDEIRSFPNMSPWQIGLICAIPVGTVLLGNGLIGYLSFSRWQRKRAKAKAARPTDPTHDEAGSTKFGPDDLYERAVEVTIEAGTCSISHLQRELEIGYGRAARIIDRMAEEGIVGPYNGPVPRDVLLSLEQWQSERKG